MDRLLALALVALVVVASSPLASAGGRRLEQATATAVAVSGPGSTAVANADATSDGTGTANSNAESIATDGSTAISDVSTTAEDGATVSASVKSHASNGAYVKGVVDLTAEEGAVAVYDLLLGASGDKVLAVKVWGEGFRTYEGNVIALTLWKAYEESEEMGIYATDACAIAFADLLREYPDNYTYIAPIIVSAVRRPGPAANYFGGVIIKAYETEGCEFVQPYCLAAEKLAAVKFNDKNFVKSIAVSPELLSCIYDTECDDDMADQCCKGEVMESGKCQCVGDDCNFKLFWEGEQLIWKCIADACAKKSKCTCPISS